MKYRFVVFVRNTRQWYAIMHECRVWFGKDWKTQPKVKRKLSKIVRNDCVPVWFEVPDETWATWVSTKLSLEICLDKKYQKMQ